MEKDIILKGLTLTFANGRPDQLLVTMAVSVRIENGKEEIYPIPEIATLSLEPYRQVISLNDKHALVSWGSEVEFHVTGTDDELKVALIRAKERKNPLSLKELITLPAKS